MDNFQRGGARKFCGEHHPRSSFGYGPGKKDMKMMVLSSFWGSGESPIETGSPSHDWGLVILLVLASIVINKFHAIYDLDFIYDAINI